VKRHAKYFASVLIMLFYVLDEPELKWANLFLIGTQKDFFTCQIIFRFQKKKSNRTTV